MRHPAKHLIAPDGEDAEIDVMLVSLIEALWAAGYETITCCQDLGESAGEASPRSAAHWKGYALLEMPVPDTCRLLDSIKRTRAFRPRMHWASDGAWEVTVPVIASHPFTGHAALAPWVQIHFPADQVDELTSAVRKQARASR